MGPRARERAPGWAPIPPAASSGAAVAHSAAARPFPKPPKSPRGQETPGSPSRRVSDRRAGPKTSPPRPEKVRGSHSPAGAAVAAAVPEVPDGVPKLKAMSREQGTKVLLPRHSVHSAFQSGEETASRSGSSASFLA